MSVRGVKAEVFVERPEVRFGPIASIVGEADGSGIPLANPKTAYSLRGIVPQIRRPRAERGACQQDRTAEVRIFARRRGGGITRTGADAPQGMMAMRQPG